MNAPTKRVTFAGSGADALAARIDPPAGDPLAWALFAHYFTCKGHRLRWACTSAGGEAAG